MSLDELRAGFLACQAAIRVLSDADTVVFDPELDVQRVLDLASWILNSWPEDSAHDMALLALASATGALLIDPSPATLANWRRCRAEHAWAL